MFTESFYRYVSSYLARSKDLGIGFVSGELELVQPTLETVVANIAHTIVRVGNPSTLVFGISGDLDSAVAALLLQKACLQDPNYNLKGFYVQNELQPARIRRIRRLIRYLNSNKPFADLEVFDCAKAIQVMSEVLSTPTNISDHGHIK